MYLYVLCTVVQLIHSRGTVHPTLDNCSVHRLAIDRPVNNLNIPGVKHLRLLSSWCGQPLSLDQLNNLICSMYSVYRAIVAQQACLSYMKLWKLALAYGMAMLLVLYKCILFYLSCYITSEKFLINDL